jgi:hypothetical protein
LCHSKERVFVVEEFYKGVTCWEIEWEPNMLSAFLTLEKLSLIDQKCRDLIDIMVEYDLYYFNYYTITMPGIVFLDRMKQPPLK